MSTVPLILRGMVASLDPANAIINVMLQMGQVVPVRMGYHGYADDLRINQLPLPVRGTYGLVAFPQGDIRNGIWMMAYYPNFKDAVHSGPESGGLSTDPSASAIEYKSHFSGHWSLHDGAGNSAWQWPEKSSFVVGNSGVVPTIYRHTVDEGQNRTQQPFTMDDRVVTAPANFPFVFHHNSGTTISIDPNGNVSITTAPQANISMTTPSGDIFQTANKTLTVIATGNVNITSKSNLVAQITGNLQATVNGSATLNIDGSASATIGGTLTCNAAGNINLNASTAVNIVAPSINLN